MVSSVAIFVNRMSCKDVNYILQNIGSRHPGHKYKDIPTNTHKMGSINN